MANVASCNYALKKKKNAVNVRFHNFGILISKRKLPLTLSRDINIPIPRIVEKKVVLKLYGRYFTPGNLTAVDLVPKQVTLLIFVSPGQKIFPQEGT